MTVTPLVPASLAGAPKPPAWSDAVLADLVAAVRAGDDLDALSAQFLRGKQAMLTRLRLFLPVDERKCPSDRVLPRLFEHLGDDSYDWKDALLRTPKPPPVIKQCFNGIRGLTSRQLVFVGKALLADPFTDEQIVAEVKEELHKRGLDRRVRALLAGRLVDRGADWYEAEETVSYLWGASWWGQEEPYGEANLA